MRTEENEDVVVKRKFSAAREMFIDRRSPGQHRQRGHTTTSDVVGKYEIKTSGSQTKKIPRGRKTHRHALAVEPPCPEGVPN
jgi:hypothetical protein